MWMVGFVMIEASEKTIALQAPCADAVEQQCSQLDTGAVLGVARSLELGKNTCVQTCMVGSLNVIEVLVRLEIDKYNRGVVSCF